MIAFCSIALVALSPYGHAEQSDAQRQLNQNMKDADRIHQRLEQDRVREEMRDKSHDGRIKVGNGVSIGGEVREGGAGVNVKIDMDRKDD
jgi:hypothetical protein